MSSQQKWLPIDPGMARELVASERWISKVRVNPDTGCHEWQGAPDRGGYGHIWVSGKQLRAHRVIAVAVRGEDLPLGYTPDHLCFNPPCVNPDHLEVVTWGENSRRSRLGGITADHAQRSHCPQGHPLIPGNLVDTASIRRTRWRRCLACHNVHQEARRQILREAAQRLGLPQKAYIKSYGGGPNKAREILGLPMDDRPLERLVFDGVITLPPGVMARCLAHLDGLAVDA